LSIVGPTDSIKNIIKFSDNCPLSITTNVHQLRRALRPLLSNALEHSVPLSQIAVDISFSSKTNVLSFSISNLSSKGLTCLDVGGYFKHMYHSPAIDIDTACSLRLISTQGLGLGLYISHKTLEALCSRLTLTSALTAASSFFVTFQFDLAIIGATSISSDSVLICRHPLLIILFRPSQQIPN
jgi:signal transduction histidine kinase